MSDPQTVLAVRDLCKEFGRNKAVDGLTFAVQRGEIFGLLGPNGAGKTTTIRMVLDIIRPDHGEIHVLGGPMDEAKKSRIGYLPEERGLYPDMTLWDTLLFLGRLKGLTRRTAAERAESHLNRVGLWEVRRRKIEALSRGMAQKAQFVAAVLHEPELIIVDEPFSGLDPVNTRLIKELIYERARGGAAVIMCTHKMHQVEEMCQRILLVNRGRQLLYGPLQEIRRRLSAHAVEVTVSGQLQPIPGVLQLEPVNGALRLLLDADTRPEQVLQRVMQMPGVTVEGFRLVEISLDEIFVTVVGGEAQQEGDRP